MVKTYDWLGKLGASIAVPKKLNLSFDSIDSLSLYK
jgi:hypothetical protein